jgi:hypothetical protein
VLHSAKLYSICKQMTRLERLAMDNHSFLWSPFVSYICKKFYYIGPRPRPWMSVWIASASMSPMNATALSWSHTRYPLDFFKKFTSVIYDCRKFMSISKHCYLTSIGAVTVRQASISRMTTCQHPFDLTSREGC